MTSVIDPRPEARAAAAAPPPPTASLRTRALRGSVWSALGYGTSQALRFGANLVLTHLLFPGAFGTMAVVNSFIIGLHLFSDLGVVPGIIQNRRGDDPRYLDTAWTIQAMRGVLLWLAACALAQPVAGIYGMPDLAWLLPVAAFTTVLDGLCSTKLYLLSRHLALRKFVLIEVGTQLVCSAVMIAWACLAPSIWALIAGALCGEAFRTLASHRLPGARNRLHWDRAIAAEQLHFGKWIFLSTVLTFLAEQSDRLIFGKLITREELGVYNIAFMLAVMVPNAIQRIGDTVFFPSFSRMLETEVDFRPGFRAARAALSSLGGYVVAGMIAAGPPVIALLYDERYANAGWMLQLLAAGAWFMILESSTGAALLAMGHVRLRAAGNFAKVLGMVALIPLGYAAHGFAGAIVALSVAQTLKYAVAAFGARRSDLPVLGADLLLSAWVAASGIGALLVSEAWRASGAGPLPSAFLAIALVTAAWLPPALALWRVRAARAHA
jgi:O-antigen/teichoic acid export membrane protein